MIELKGWMVWIPLTGLLLHFLSGQLHFPWPNSDSEWHRCLHQWVGNPEVTRSCFPENFPEVSGDVTKSDLLIKEYRLATKNLASIGELLPEPLGKLQHLRYHPQKSAITTWELGACEVCGWRTTVVQYHIWPKFFASQWRGWDFIIWLHQWWFVSSFLFQRWWGHRGGGPNLTYLKWIQIHLECI